MKNIKFIDFIDFGGLFHRDMGSVLRLVVPINNITFVGTPEENNFLHKIIFDFNQEMTRALDRQYAICTPEQIERKIEINRAPMRIYNLFFDINKKDVNSIIDSGFEKAGFDYNPGEPTDFVVSCILESKIVDSANNIMLNMIFGGGSGLLYLYEQRRYNNMLFLDIYPGYQGIAGDSPATSISHTVFKNNADDFGKIVSYFLEMIKPLYPEA